MNETGVGSDLPIETLRNQRIVDSIRACPPVPPITTVCAFTLLLVLIYGTLWGMTGSQAVPGGPIFGLFALVVFCYLGGQLIGACRLPTLVGEMLVGFALRNVPHINVAKDIPEEWSENIRNMALILILLRAGLELDEDILKNNKSTSAKLIFIPFIAELIAAGLAAHYLLRMPWTWSFVMGSLLAAISPAVVLPIMLKLQKQGIGVTTGIPTLVIAVAGIDDVLSLAVFGTMIGITFSTGSLVWIIAKGPLQMVAGIIYGILLGIVTWYIPHPDEKSASVFHFLMLCLGGTFVLFGSHALQFGPAGALGCICLPFVAGIGWKRENIKPVEGALAFVWMIIEPFLFGLVGSEIRIDYLKPNVVGLSLATLFFGIGARILTAFASACSSGLSRKEQIFVTVAGLPKATVQAAIGPVAFHMAKKHQLGSEAEAYGITILTAAVLSILITAPIGATSIAVLAPRLLDKKANDQEKQIPDDAIEDSKPSSINNETESNEKAQSSDKP